MYYLRVVISFSNCYYKLIQLKKERNFFTLNFHNTIKNFIEDYLLVLSIVDDINGAPKMRYNFGAILLFL